VPNLRTLATRVNGKAPAPITAVIEADSNREDSNRGNISKEELNRTGVETRKTFKFQHDEKTRPRRRLFKNQLGFW
jgi:hypothetical protein